MNTIYFLLIVFVSCILQGVTGFGFAVLAAPLGFLIFDQQTIVVALTVVSFVLNLFLLSSIRVKMNKALVVKLVVTGILGIPIGIAALTFIASSMLKLATGVISLAFALVLLYPRAAIRERSQLTILMGLLTGFLQSSVGVSGPPLVLVLTGYGLEPKVMRRTLATLFFLLSLVSLPLFFWKHILTVDRFILGGLAVPLVVVGAWFGNKIADRVPKKLFRYFVLSLTIVVGIQLITSAVL